MSPFQGFKSGLCAFSIIMPSLRDCLLPVDTLWIRMISDVVYPLFATSPFKIPKGWSYRSKQNASLRAKPRRVADSSGIFMSPFQGFGSGFVCGFSIIMPSLRDCLLPVGTLWIRMISDVVYPLFTTSPFKIPKGWNYCSKKMPILDQNPHRGGRFVRNIYVTLSGFQIRPLCFFYNNAIPSGLLLPVGTLWIRMISDVVYPLFTTSPFKIPKGWSYRSKQNASPPHKTRRGWQIRWEYLCHPFRVSNPAFVLFL
jgi:hypothetical protein